MAIDSFSSDLAAFSRVTGIEIEEVVRKVAISAHNSVVRKTPVKTGQARRDWNIRAGSPDLSINNDVEADALTNLTKGDGLGPIYITNSLPYIEKLEDGHSNQTPNGMVAVTMAEIDAGIANAIRK